MTNLFAKLWELYYDKHMGPAEKLERLEQYRGEGEDATVYTLQDRLHKQMGDGLSEKELIELLRSKGG